MLLNPFVWTDITAEVSLDLLLYPSLKQKWKLRSPGGLNLFQLFLFFPKNIFSPPGKEEGKKKRDIYYGIF